MTKFGVNFQKSPRIESCWKGNGDLPEETSGHVLLKLMRQGKNVKVEVLETKSAERGIRTPTPLRALEPESIRGDVTILPYLLLIPYLTTAYHRAREKS